MTDLKEGQTQETKSTSDATTRVHVVFLSVLIAVSFSHTLKLPSDPTSTVLIGEKAVGSVKVQENSN